MKEFLEEHKVFAWEYRRAYKSNEIDPLETGYGIYEVYVDINGTPIFISEEPTYLFATSLEELVGDVRKLLRAMFLPVLDHTTLKEL